MKVFVDSIGCRLNQSEIEIIAGQFRAAGHEVVSSPGEADLVVVNTCAVTAEAASDSRQKIRQAARAGAREVVVTGCWATLDPLGAEALPAVRKVVLNSEKETLAADVLGLPAETFDLEPLAREPLPGIHQRTRAFIKVQDGCDNHCTFCVTRIARGKGKSSPVKQILSDIHIATAGGAKEIVLTGVHLGSWGHDLDTPQHLKDLIRTILVECDMKRLRLSSLEPWDLDEGFFDLWQDARMCPHLHLPLQSGSETILRRMARKTTPSNFARLVEQARSTIPDLAVTTDLIVGFPGETDALFEESLGFIREMKFAAGHVFSFSARPGTPAAKYVDMIPPAVRKQRSATLRKAVQEDADDFHRKYIDRELPVLWETSTSLGPGGWRMEGLTGNYLRVSAFSPTLTWNQIQTVRITDVSSEGLSGEIFSVEDYSS